MVVFGNVCGNVFTRIIIVQFRAVSQEYFVFSVYINKTSGVFGSFSQKCKKISILTLAFGHFSYFRLSVLCKNTFVIFIHFIYQSLLLCALELFYMILPAHCLLFRGKVLEIDQLHRSACLCIFGTFPELCAFMRFFVICPTGIKCAVSTPYNICIIFIHICFVHLNNQRCAYDMTI